MLRHKLFYIAKHKPALFPLRRHYAMVPRDESLESYLKNAKSSLASAIRDGGKVTIVVGNQSADLDSLTSSILYAYFRSQVPPEDAFTPLYIPLLNLPAADISLRPEFHTLLQLCKGVDVSDLCFLESLPPLDRLAKDLPPENTRWILVDHNKLEGVLGAVYGSRVHGVIDHHEDEHAVPADTAPEPRVIQSCGSCTSLVVQYIRSSWNQALFSASNAEGAWREAQAAKLALGSILVDTRNLKDEVKVGPADVETAKFLVQKIRGFPGRWDQNAFYDELDSAKRDLKGMALDGILRKDYKEWTEAGMKLGMSSVIKPLSFILGKAAEQTNSSIESTSQAWAESALTFMGQRDLSIWAIMTAHVSAGEEGKDGEFARELYIQAKDSPDGLESKAVAAFEEHALNLLGLTSVKIEGMDSPSIRTWNQMRVEKSRKQVAPLLRRVIRENGHHVA